MNYTDLLLGYLDGEYGNSKITELDGGKIISFNKNGLNGIPVSYDIYVPDNIENPQIYLYMHGSDGYNSDCPDVRRYLDYADNNSIIVATSGTITYSDDVGKEIIDVGNAVANCVGSTNDLRSSGFSAGGHAAVKTTIEYINENPNCDSQVVMLIDAGGEYKGEIYAGNVFKKLTASDYKTLRENGTLFVTFMQDGNYNGIFGNKNGYADAINNGLNMLVIRSDSDHGLQRANAFGDNGIGFISGMMDELENGDRYTYTFYDREKGEWIPVTAEEARQIIEKIPSNKTRLFYTNNLRMLSYMDESDYSFINNCNDTIKANFEYIKTNVNKLIYQIKNSTLYNTTCNTNYASTTKNPSGYSELINDFALSSLFVLEKTAIAIQNIQAASKEIQNLQVDLIANIENL